MIATGSFCLVLITKDFLKIPSHFIPLRSSYYSEKCLRSVNQVQILARPVCIHFTQEEVDSQT